MLPSRHIIASVSLGAVIAYFTQSLSAGLLCLVSGVLIDIDHFFEYIMHHGLSNLNPGYIYRACERLSYPEKEGGVKKLYLLFHVAEIAVLLWAGFLFTRNIYILALAAGYTLHLVMDAATNKIKPYAYFMSFRMKNRFNTAVFRR